MSQVVRRPLPAALACLFVLALASFAHGQGATPYFRVRPDAPSGGSGGSWAAPTTGGYYGGLNRGYYNAPYLPWNPYTYYQDPNSAFLSGTADILSASGDLAIKQQQASLIAQDVKSAKLANHRRAWEQWEWEQQHTPTLEDERERERVLQLRRARNDPPETEITSGAALNVVLKHLEVLQGQGMVGPAIPIDPELLRQVNVFAAGTRSANSIGIMSKVDNLHWPMALREDFFDDERKEITKTLQQLAVEGESNNVDFKKIKKLREILNNMVDELKDHQDDITIYQHIEAKRFIKEVQGALNTLQDENVGNYFNGKWSAKGNTVAELVDYMSKQGLRFAASVSGNEPSYIALHRLMADYDSALTQVTLRPGPGGPPGPP
jgi:hypothetical protein